MEVTLGEAWNAAEGFGLTSQHHHPSTSTRGKKEQGWLGRVEKMRNRREQCIEVSTCHTIKAHLQAGSVAQWCGHLLSMCEGGPGFFSFSSSFFLF